MKILVIGGSYFLGLTFVMTASKEHEITLVNRGNQPLQRLGLNIKELCADRHNQAFFRELKEDYDAVVDFCAYAPGDIAGILNHLGGQIGQYILISTVDVYAHGKEEPDYKRIETYPMETTRYTGEIGDYIWGKVAVENELTEIGKNKGIPFTILRPAIIYGELNYTPREQIFIKCMELNQALPQFTDADGNFQMVYVRDVVQAITACLNNKKAYNECFNICGDELLSYDIFADTLIKASGLTITKIPRTLEEAEKSGFPITFPVKKEENHLCDNHKSKDVLGMKYTSLQEGMKKTVAAAWGAKEKKK